MRANRLVLITVFTATLLFFSTWQTAIAGPPEKLGNPGVPGLLAEIAELEAIIQEYEELAPVPQTGQTQSYVPGDDGDLQIGVPWPDPRFTDNLDDTVLDNLTSLIWTKNANLYGWTTLNDALSSCSSCGEGGETDWRLPNVRELQSLIDYGEAGRPMLPTGHPFTGPFNVSDRWSYWSSTTQGNTSAFCISFENGFMWSLSTCNVWCVRGGY